MTNRSWYAVVVHAGAERALAFWPSLRWLNEDRKIKYLRRYRRRGEIMRRRQQGRKR